MRKAARPAKSRPSGRFSVRFRPEELGDEVAVRSVQFHTVKSGTLAADGGFDEGRHQFFHLCLGQRSGWLFRALVTHVAGRNGLPAGDGARSPKSTVEDLHKACRAAGAQPIGQLGQARQLMIAPHAHFALPALTAFVHVGGRRRHDAETSLCTTQQPSDFIVRKKAVVAGLFVGHRREDRAVAQRRAAAKRKRVEGWAMLLTSGFGSGKRPRMRSQPSEPHIRAYSEVSHSTRCIHAESGPGKPVPSDIAGKAIKSKQPSTTVTP